MASTSGPSNSPSPPGAPGGRRRGPGPPTLDLTATEVASEQAQRTTAGDSDPALAPSDAPERVTTESAPPEAATKALDPARTERPPGPRPIAFAPVIGRWAHIEHPWQLIGSAAFGAGVAVVIFIGAWLVFPTPRQDDSATFAGRLAAIEARLAALSARPDAPAGDPKQMGELSARLASVEASLRRLDEMTSRLAATEQALRRLDDLNRRLAQLETAPAPRSAADPALAERIGAAETSVKSLAERLSDLARRLDEVNAALVRRFDEMSAAVRDAQRAAAAQAEVPTAPPPGAADRAVRLAFVSAALSAAIERGNPFTTELAAIRLLLADPSALGKFETFAATGIPSAGALARELSALAPAMFAAAAAPAREGGIISRLQTGAERLVRIRPIDERPGDDPTTVIARIEVRATHEDIPGALAELAKLPAGVRAPAEAWVKKAEARLAAIDLSRKIAAEAFAALGKTTP